MPVGYWPVSRTARTLIPVVVVVLAIRSTMTWWLVSGRPRQFKVIWENSRCSILFHLLVPGREMGDGHPQAGFGGERGELDLPGPDPGSVGPAAVGADQEPLRGRVAGAADGVPPGAQGGDGERGRVVVGPDADPAGVGGHVIDAVGDRLTELLVGEVVDVDLLGLPGRLVLPAAGLEDRKSVV